MMETSVADLFNCPTEIEFEGHKFKLRHANVFEAGLYQRWLESEARASAGRATELPEEMQRQLLRDVNADITAKVYAWNGVVCVKSLQTPDGVAKITKIVLANQGVPDDVVERYVERHLHECVALVWKQHHDDPKALAVVLEALGLPPDFLSDGSSDSPPRPSTETPENSPDSAPPG